LIEVLHLPAMTVLKILSNQMAKTDDEKKGVTY
jgi:hypothetical protein